MGDEGDDSRKENLTGLDHLKRLRLDSSAIDTDEVRNLVLQGPRVPVDPSYDLTIHDAGGGGGLGSPHVSHVQQEDNEELNTGGGHEKIVSGIGGKVVNEIGGQGELDDQGVESGLGQEEFDIEMVDKKGGNEASEPSDKVAQDEGSSE